MEWLILLLVPIALLVLATHLLGGAIALRELRNVPAQFRRMPRKRALFFAYVGLGGVIATAEAWVFENPEHWHTAAWVLLAAMGIAAGWALLVVPVFIWREYRDHRRRLVDDGGRR